MSFRKLSLDGDVNDRMQLWTAGTAFRSLMVTSYGVETVGVRRS
jgi:hypothetical protein